jgi:HSP20 family protein
MKEQNGFAFLSMFFINYLINKGFAMLQLISPFRPQFYSATSNRQAFVLAAADVIEESNRFILRFDLPGIAPENVDLQVTQNLLTIKAERQQLDLAQDGRLLRSERSNGLIEREFKLPDSVDVQSIEAKHQHGVLEVVLNKRAEIAPRKIAIAA